MKMSDRSFPPLKLGAACPRVGIIADDLTGCGDAGAFCFKAGLRSRIFVSIGSLSPASAAGCDAVIDKGATIANLLVRSVQDIGVSDVVSELLSSEMGSELYRAKIDPELVGKTYRDYAIKMIDESISVIGIARGHKNLINPDLDLVLESKDEAFIVAKEPPR